MNSQMGFSSKLRRLTAPVCVMIRGELAIGAHLRAASYGLRASPRLILFLIHINNLPMWALWSCGRRVSVVQAQRQIHRVLLATDTAAGETMRPRRATRR